MTFDIGKKNFNRISRNRTVVPDKHFTAAIERKIPIPLTFKKTLRVQYHLPVSAD